ALVAASAVYAVTDPLMRPVRRAVPPVNFGGIGLDVAFLVVFLGVVLLRVLVLVLAGNL
ncbi:YggT family protein, partial [Micrococcus endophyticus]